MYNLSIPRVILKRLHLAPKFAMIRYREDWPIPSIEFPRQVKVKSIMTGICTSDLHQINVNVSNSMSIIAKKQKLFPLGHEALGEIVETGDEMDNLQVNDRVVHSPVVSCRSYGFKLCPSCQNGNPQTCYAIIGQGDGSPLETFYGGRGNFGGFGSGGFNEYFVGFEHQFTRVPDGVPDRIAVLSEPLAVALHGVVRNMPNDDDDVLVIGAGIIGLMTIASLRGIGSKARIISAVKYPFQRDFAKAMGADDVVFTTNTKEFYSQIAELTEGGLFKPILGKNLIYGDKGVDIIFDTVSTDSTLDDAIRLVRTNGKIVIVGMGYGVTKKTEWVLQVMKEVEIVGSMMHGLEKIGDTHVDTMELALNIMKKDSRPFIDLVTHEYRIEDYQQAFIDSMNKGSNGMVKGVFNFIGYSFDD